MGYIIVKAAGCLGNYAATIIVLGLTPSDSDCLQHNSSLPFFNYYIFHTYSCNWASEASPTLGCSIEISRDICCRYVSYVKLTALTELCSPRACSKSFLGGKD